MDGAEAAAAAVEAEKSKSIVPILIVILVFTLGAVGVSSGLEYDTIMKNWDSRRCDLGVMMAARFFKPPGDERTPSQFAKDNFDFCMKQTQDTAINATLAPAMAVAAAQKKAVETLETTQGTAKASLTNFANAIVVQILRDFYHRVELFGDQIRRTFNGLSLGFKKIQAAVMSLVFIGLAMAQGIINFYNLVILVVIIILSILAALFIILIFVLWPFLPTIVAILATLTAAGFGSLVGGLGATFCFDGRTRVRLANGQVKKMRDLLLGEVLEGGGVVEGMHMMDGRRADMYKVVGADGMPIYVSGDHLVWRSETRVWGYVRDLPGVERAPHQVDVVYCPTVSNRCLRVGGLWFRDWEELPEWAEDEWEAMMEAALNGERGRAARGAGICHTGAVNGVRGHVEVYEKTRGYISIREVCIGDEVAWGGRGGAGGLTRVLGKTTALQPGLGDAELAAGTWVWDSATGLWVHPGGLPHTIHTHRIAPIVHNLITDAGEFEVRLRSGQRLQIRDAFEVGLEGMERTYEFTLRTLNSSDNSPPITEE